MWTEQHAAQARSFGWGVFEVWNGKSMKAVILPLQFTKQMPHAPAMLNRIVQLAQERDALSIVALRHCAQVNR